MFVVSDSASGEKLASDHLLSFVALSLSLQQCKHKALCVRRPTLDLQRRQPDACRQRSLPREVLLPETFSTASQQDLSLLEGAVALSKEFAFLHLTA